MLRCGAGAGTARSQNVWLLNKLKQVTKIGLLCKKIIKTLDCNVKAVQTGAYQVEVGAGARAKNK